MRYWTLCAVLGVCLLSVVGCGGVDDTSSHSASSTTAERSAGTADVSEFGPITSMLALVPDAEENRSLLTINDYDGALAAAGVEWPSSDDEEAIADLLGELTVIVSPTPPILLGATTFGARPLPLDDWRREVGFTVLDAQRDAATGEAPGVLSIVRTGRQPSEIEEALRTDPVWSGDLRVRGEGDGAFFVWGDDPLALDLDLARASGPRPLARGGAMAVLDDGTVIRSPDPDVVAASLSVSNGGTRSLLDDPSFVTVAEALDAAGVYTAHLTSENVTVDPLFLLGPLDGPPPSAEEIEERLAEITTVPPYLALGIGNKVDLDADPQGVLVLAFAATSPEAAEQTVSAIEATVSDGVSIVTRTPWSDQLTVTSTSVEGSVAVVEFRTDNPRIGIISFQQRDVLFASF